VKSLATKKLNPSVAVIFGTRPEIVKLAPVLEALRDAELRHFVIYTGQHYSPRMGRDIYDGFRLKPPRYRLPFQRQWRTHGQQTGQMLGYVEKVLLDERPQWVLVQGDVNSTLAGALAAKKLGIRVAHLEAGLRSFDPRMPEEHNRIMVDHISDLLFAPTEWAARQLKRESVRGAIHMVGNTVVDAVLANRVAARESGILKELGLAAKQPFFLFTLHRQENLEGPHSLDTLSELLHRVIEKFDFPVVFPIHPGTLARLKDSRHLDELEKLEKLKLVPPLRYLDFLRLLGACRLVFTDSGGVQEEACILRVPAVTLRDNTERPETLQVGSNLLAGLDARRAVNAARAMLRRPRRWSNPFGNGRTGELVVKILRKEMQAGR
jgi:UDP-N-acetylglucosamine 2-epimerase (non-hydrolysing)